MLFAELRAQWRHAAIFQHSGSQNADLKQNKSTQYIK